MKDGRLVTFSRFACTAMALFACMLSGCGKKTSEAAPPTTMSAPPPVNPPGSGSRLAPPPAADLSQVVVTVDGKTLTRGDIENQLAIIMSDPRYAGAPPQALNQIRGKQTQQVVQLFVNQTLLENAMAGVTVELSEEDFAEAFDELSRNLPPGETMEQALTRNGVTLEKLRADLTPNLKIKKFVMGKVGPVEDATQAEIEAYYTENPQQFKAAPRTTARHILIKTSAEDDDAAKAEKRALAETYIKELRDGADFAAYARDYSQGPSGSSGGSLGTFSPGAMVPAFDRAAFTLPVGEISDIVETDYGYHIIQVQEREEGVARLLAEVSEEIGEALKNRRVQVGAAGYLQELTAQAKIEFANMPRQTPPGSGSKPPAGSGSK
jgi:parvulin-like peptidyl-prolyl isomerase